MARLRAAGARRGLLLWLAALASSACAAASAFAVVGYLPEWRYGGANFELLFETLTHLAFFSAEPSASGALLGLDRLPDAETLAAAKAAAARTGTKLLLCLGGNGRSAGFAAATSTPAARQRRV